jgi:hypothetical protein
MFEQEVEMEKRQSSIVPLLLIVALTVGLVGVAAYYLVQSHKVMSNSDATNISLQALQAAGPATLTFATGMVHESVNEKPRDPNYRLLEKIGVLKLGKAKGWITPVSLTPKGEQLLSQISGVEKTKEQDGTETYTVPLAERRLIGISKVTMLNPDRASIEFSWQWQANALGESFDASGNMVQSFNTWDRATLIQKYGATFFHAAPSPVTLAAVRLNGHWQIASE